MRVWFWGSLGLTGLSGGMGAFADSAGWRMQDVAKVPEPAEKVASAGYTPVGWYRATVPGTVLTTLVDNKVYPEPLYGENMRAIPESLNKTSYWYRTLFVTFFGGEGTVAKGCA